MVKALAREPSFFKIIPRVDGLENSLVVRQVNIPFDKIDTVLQCQSSVQIEMVFQMTEESFDTIRGRGYFRIVQIMKHVGQGPFDGQV